jgi:imidazolonepropionase-like amidohydrolase
MDARKFARPGIPQDAIASIGVVADGPDAARRAAWEQLARGADLIKINATLSEYVRASGGQCSPEMTREMMQAICEVAHATGRKVAAHCHGGPGVSDAIEVGVDTFEHGRFLTDEMIDGIAERGKFLVPTLSPEAKRVVLNDLPTDPALALWNKQATDAMYATVAKAHARGVKVVAGTDAGMPHVVHGILAFEMEHLAMADMTNADAIASATRIAAEAMGLERTIGQVRTGYVADLLAVDGDPLQDLRILQDKERIKLVLQGGNLSVDRR